MKTCVTINMNPYPFKLFVFSQHSLKEIVNKVNKQGFNLKQEELIIENNEEILGKSFLFHRFCIIYLPDFTFSSMSLAALVHELFHIIEMIMTDIDIKLSDDSSESFAYLLDYSFKECLNQFIKNTKLNTIV